MKTRWKELGIGGKCAIIRATILVLLYNSIVVNISTLNPILTKIRPTIIVIGVILTTRYFIEIFPSLKQGFKHAFKSKRKD